MLGGGFARARGLNDARTAIGTPDWTVNAGGEFDVLPHLTLTARALYTSRQFVDLANTQSIPNWRRFDVGARTTLDIGQKHVTFRLNIENLFNKGYWASAFSGITLGAPRTISLSATVDL